MPRRLFVALAALAVVSNCQGCFGCQTPVDNPNSTLPTSCEQEQPLIEPQKLDILFVIDNSGSMKEEQEAVARELTAFVDQIKQAGGVRQDFHIGVITTSVYQHSNQNGLDWWLPYPNAGRLRPVPDFLEDGGVRYDTDNERILVGDDPQVVEKFAKLVQQGTYGSGQETPFEAIRLALMSQLATTPLDAGGNEGFMRDGARLLVTVLTDEDDCSELARPSVVKVSDDPGVNECTRQAMSLTPVSEYFRFFTQDLKNADGSSKEGIFAAIAPVGIDTKAVQEIVDNGRVKNIDCPTSNQAGERIKALAQMFDPTLANLDSICKSSFRETLIAIAELASVSQFLEVKNVPDERMLQLNITRKDGTIQPCTIANQGIVSYTKGVDGAPAKLRFGNQCRRRADDQKVQVGLLCAL
ncbi:MAG: VWA domain-containing protein [Myxococcota bacterium]